MAFPIALTNAIDGVTEMVAAHLNELEAKVGVDGSAVVTSLDYKLKSTASTDPGHKHTAGVFNGGTSGDVFFKDPADSIWKPVQPDTANLVARTGAQSVSGIKTFSAIPVLPASDPTTANEATRKDYVNTQDALKVSKAGDTMSGPLAMGAQNITGVGTLVAATAQLANALAVIYGGIGLQTVAAGDILYASALNTILALTKAAVGNVLLSGDAPSWGKVALTTHVSGVLPSANGGDGGTTVSGSGPITVTSALNRQSYVATGVVEYDLPSGDLSAFLNTGVVPLRYTFVKASAGALTVDPGTGNFISDGIASAVLRNIGAETYGTVTVQLISSSASVNKWVIVGYYGTWDVSIPSVSPSKSPSVSPSASISPSVSPSISPSISPSVSSSISPSVSPSVSPSESPSASISPSVSPSVG